MLTADHCARTARSFLMRLISSLQKMTAHYDNDTLRSSNITMAEGLQRCG
jgi:hypothetical protein